MWFDAEGGLEHVTVWLAHDLVALAKTLAGMETEKVEEDVVLFKPKAASVPASTSRSAAGCSWSSG